MGTIDGEVAEAMWNWWAEFTSRPAEPWAGLPLSWPFYASVALQTLMTSAFAGLNQMMNSAHWLAQKCSKMICSFYSMILRLSSLLLVPCIFMLFKFIIVLNSPFQWKVSSFREGTVHCKSLILSTTSVALIFPDKPLRMVYLEGACIQPRNVHIHTQPLSTQKHNCIFSLYKA